MNQPSLDQQILETNEPDSFDAFMKKFEALSTPMDKLRIAIDFMRTSLSQKAGNPFFKGFWEARRLCLPLFKEQIVTPNRSQLWGEYVELTREGRRLKNLLDEESAFAVEQIEIAVKSLEEEMNQFRQNPQDLLSKIVDIVPNNCKILEQKHSFYEAIQKKLNLLNVYASRIHALRKELIKTEMRIRHKNKFFERLSVLGDVVFPARKDLIKDVSDSFISDIKEFVDDHFSEHAFCHEKVRRQVFYYRDEIKNLQALAKILTLNTQAFTATRELLSASWDKLKGMEKELKKEFTQQKAQSQENTAVVVKKIQEIAEQFANQTLTAQEALAQFDHVSRWMRDLELTHTDVKSLKEELRTQRIQPEKKIEEEENQRRQKEAEIEEKRREELLQFKTKVETLRDKRHAIDIETFDKEFLEIRAQFNNLNVPKREKQQIERLIKEIRDMLEEKKEERLIHLSDETRADLENLQEVLSQRKERRAAIKTQIEEFRKVIGGSTLDFEKAIEYGELMANEKERLEKMDEGIREIEDKINQLKKKH